VRKKYITVIDASFLNIPNCSLLNNVPHKKSLDSLVLFSKKTQIVKIYSLTNLHTPKIIYIIALSIANTQTNNMKISTHL